MSRPQDSTHSPRQTLREQGVRDQTGEPVEVVRKDIEQPNPATEGVDKALTPTSVETQEQNAEKIRQRTGKVQQKLRAGNKNAAHWLK